MKNFLVSFLGLMLGVFFAGQIAAQNNTYVEGELFVKTKEGINTNLGGIIPINVFTDFDILSIEKPFKTKSTKLQQTYLVKFDDVEKADQLIETLQQLTDIEYAEKVPNYQLFYTPNDPMLNQQWNLQTILAEQAWDINTGNSNVIIAMTDDAILLSHQDLQNNIFNNPNEIPANNIDDDNNGYIDDVNGWDAADNDNDPNPLNPTNSYFSHGTHCAGISAATTDNNLGIASIGFNTTLLPVKIGASSNSSLTGAYIGVDYAIACGYTDIISMSWGGGAYSATYQNLFDQAHAQGIVNIAAAGNSSTSTPMYPASYNHVISVGATDPTDTKAGFSNYGTAIDVMAPGTNILSTVAGSTSGYGYKSGTSMACPLVSGIAALMLSQDPSLSPDDLESCLKSTCDNIDNQNSNFIGQIGAGRVNAFEALQCLKAINADFEADFTHLCPGSTINFTDLSNNNPTGWEWDFPGGIPATSNQQNPTVTYPASGQYDVTLIVTNANGTDTLTQSVYITVATPTATLSGTTTILPNYTANLVVNFTGSPPWSVTYTDGSQNYTINNITSTPYYIPVQPTVTTTYSLVSMNDNFCAGTVSDSAIITVIGNYQTQCITLRPDSANGKDAYLRSLSPNTNYGTHFDFSATDWTFSGNPVTVRNVIDFDWSVIPANATLISANLSLYSYNSPANGSHSTLSGSNEALLQRITSPWTESTVTWNTQPTTVTQNEVLLPASTNAIQHYLNIDVTALTQDILNDQANSHGFLFKLVTESFYRRMLFASSDNADSLLHPQLDLCFAVPVSDSSCISVNTFQKISDTEGNFTGILDNADIFGQTVRSIGDLNQDGIIDLAVGASWDDDGGTDRGAVYILFMNTNGTVQSHQKISDTQGNFTGTLDNGDGFGGFLGAIGDLNTDGIMDLAVCTRNDDDGGTDRGAVYILFMNTNGTVQSHQKISDTQGNFTGVLDNLDGFGSYPEALGDLNGDLVPDIAVSATRDEDGGDRRGAVYILFMNSNGTVQSHQKISDTQGNFTAPMAFEDYFGNGIANVGDLNGDGIVDLAVAARQDNDGGTSRGAVYILFLNANGTVNQYQKISSTQGNFGGILDNNDWFASDVQPVGDLNSDGNIDIMVGASKDDDGGTDQGAYWIILLNSDGTAGGYTKISETQGNFNGVLDVNDAFSYCVANIGDLNGDGLTDFAAGARFDDDGGTDRGAVYILFNVDSCANYATCYSVIDEQKISDTEGNFTASFDNGDHYGQGIGDIGDFNGDGINDLAIAATGDDDGGTDKGAIYITFMNADGTVQSYQKISETQGGFGGTLDDTFGNGIEAIGDFNGDGVTDIAVCEPRASDPSIRNGALWILFMNANGTVQSEQKISQTQGNLGLTLAADDRFGQDVALIGDLNNDGVDDLAVGAVGDDDGGVDAGAVYILFMNANGTVSSTQKISDTQGNFNGNLNAGDYFGHSVCPIGDFNGDGTIDIAVGNRLDDDGGTNRGAVFLIMLNTNGTVQSEYKISDTQGNFNGGLSDNDYFGVSVEDIGDVNLDGVQDILVGTIFDDDGGNDRGAAYILYLASNGTVAGHFKISDTEGGFDGILDDSDAMGWAISPAGDLDGNGYTDFAVGSNADDDGGTDRGSVWIMFMGDTCALGNFNPPDCNYLNADFIATDVCIGDSTLFTDLSTDSLANINNWLWDFGDGNLLTGVQNPGHIYGNAGNYNATLIISNDSVPVCFDTVTVAVTVYDTLTIIPLVDTTICLGDSIPLGPLDFICGQPNYTYSWLPTAGLNNASSANPNASPLTTTIYTVTVTDDGGASATASVTITVDLNCCISHAGIATNTAICLGDSAYFANISTVSGNPSFQWDFGNNATPGSYTGAVPPGIYFDTDGVHTVTLILNDSCGIDTTTIDVSVFPPPVVDFVDTLAVCEFPTSIGIGDTAISNYTYAWFPSAGLSDTTASHPMATVSGPTTYYVLITNIWTGCTTLDTIDIILFNDVVDLGPDVTLCPGSSITLDATTNNGTYIWHDNTAAATHFINSPGTYWVEVNVGGCIISDTVVISFYTTPTINIGPDTTLCPGETLDLDATTAGIVSYEWQDNTLGPNYTISSAGVYEVTGFDGTCHTTDQIFVNYNTLADADLGPDLVLCPGDSVVLDATVTGGSYLWSDNSIGSAIQVTAAGTYWVQLSVANCVDFDTVQVAMTDTPVVNLGPDTTQLCIGDVFVLDASVPFGTSYLWQDNTPGPTYHVNDSGTYYVDVQNACGVTSDTITFYLEDCECTYAIPNVFTPNDDGTNDVFILNIDLEHCEMSHFIIYNRWGQKMFETETETSWDGKNEDGEIVPDGTYYYIITINDEKISGFVTKVK
jgi:gliding motility-associated-like protein